MERDFAYQPFYKGTKNFTQQEVKTAKANGFAAAADDYAERGIDLNEQLILNKPATFFFRMNGDAMHDDGIYNSDVLIVDRSIKPANGKIIIASINGDLIVRKLMQTADCWWLAAGNTKYANIPVNNFSDAMSWGIVTCVIHIFESRLLTHNNNTKNAKHKKEDFRILY